MHVSGYGVVHLSKDEAANRKIFEFAKAMGVGYLSADPDPGQLRPPRQAGRGVRHPDRHPQPRARAPYAKIDTIAKAIKDHSPKIGCCIDTGHFLRSREDPVRAVEVFGKRVYGVHLKDVKDAETFTILGQGDLRTVDLLKALAASKYALLPGHRIRGEAREPARGHQGLPGRGQESHRRHRLGLSAAGVDRTVLARL